MHSFWDSFIRPAFDILKPQSIVEIGASPGNFTSKILSYCDETGANLHAIDVAPMPEGSWTAHPLFHFYQGKSLEKLSEITAYDAVLIDGDHNWYTVFHELKHIEQTALQGKFPHVFIHDIHWPYGKRDLYYAAETIPAEFRHPSKIGGVLISRNALTDNEGINYEMTHAEAEGGERNGVGTAIRDFLGQTKMELRYFEIPGMYGLGIILDTRVCDAHPDIVKMLDLFSTSQIVRSHIYYLEHERLDSLIRHENADALLTRTYDVLRDRTDESLRRELDNLEAVFEKNDEMHKRMIGRMREEHERKQADLESELRKTVALLKRMEHSGSWKITMPLRKAGEWLSGVRKLGLIDTFRTIRRQSLHADGENDSVYQPEQLARETLTYDRWKESKERAAKGGGPTFTLVVTLESHNEIFMRSTLMSLLEQTYENWQLLAYYWEHDRLAASVLEDYVRAAGDRIVRIPRKFNHSHSIEIADILSLAKGEYVIPIMQHDILALNMLEQIASACDSKITLPQYIVISVDHGDRDRVRHTPVIITDGFGYLIEHKASYRGEVAVHAKFLQNAVQARPGITLQAIGSLFPANKAPDILLIPSVLYHRFAVR